MVSPGTYTGTFNYSRSCTPGAPLVVKASSGARVTGSLNISGQYGIFQGFEFAGAAIDIAGDNNRVTRNRFTGDPSVDFIEGAQKNRFDHNDISVVTAGNRSSNAFMGFSRPGSTAEMYNLNRIDHNYFTTNFTGTPTTEGMGIFHGKYGAETGYPIWKQYGHFRTSIDNNLFENWGRKNAIESKGSDSQFIGNTFINAGRLLIRQGDNNRIENNYFEHTKGLIVREFGHVIKNNYFTGSALALMKGERSYDNGDCYRPRDWMPSKWPGVPQGSPAVGVTIDKNRGTLIIGDMEGGSGTVCQVPVINAKILCHEGTIQRQNSPSDEGTSGPTATASCGFVMPHKLTHADVGIDAVDSSCQ